VISANLILQIIGGLVMVTGSFFALVGSLGLVRLPDLYTRLHAGSKAVTLGVGGMALGSLAVAPSFSAGAKILLAMVFLFFTAPITSHAIGRAGYYAGVRMSPDTVKDEYETYAILDKREKLLKARVRGRAWLGEKRQREVFELASQHVQRPLEAVRVMSQAVDDFLKGNLETMEEEASRTISLENEADALAVEAMEVISKSQLSPEDRGDLLNLVYRVRHVGTAAKALAYRLELAEEYHFPAKIIPGLEELAKAVMDTMETLTSAINELNKDMVVAEELSDLVSELDDVVDRIRRDLIKLLLKEARRLDAASFFVVNEVVMRLEDLADACEDAADHVRIISVKYLRLV
jgi:predicted phosphate transport protein (TIGR00153 family)